MTTLIRMVGDIVEKVELGNPLDEEPGTTGIPPLKPERIAHREETDRMLKERIAHDTKMSELLGEREAERQVS